MKRNSTFARKVVYLVCMALLLLPLSFISRPSTRRVTDDNVVREDPGGWLSQMRKTHQLSQAELGEVDPASASLNLATLGMRGVAANILWSKALYYKKTEDFTNMKASLNQISKLQPNFVSVWRFQSWDLAYNIAAEFDDYHHRYSWVKKGFDFLLRGLRYNRDDPMLLWDIGWFFGHKIGRSDDQLQFRELYRHDDEFHKTLPLDIDDTLGPDGYPDNWLSASVWYARAQDVVEQGTKPMRGKNPLIFHSAPAMALIYHAIGIEKDGYLDEKGQEAWRRAGEAWQEYGNRTVQAAGGQDQFRLNDLEKFASDIEADSARLDELAPGVRQRLRKERRDNLTDAERKALDTPARDRTLEQIELVIAAIPKLTVHDYEVADRAPPEDRKAALRIVDKLAYEAMLINVVDGFRTTVNYDYWKARCAAEQEETTIQARDYLQKAQEFSSGDYHDEEAREAFEKAWELWAKVYEKYPILMDDPTAEDIVDAIDDYRELLDVRFEESFPPPGFKLHDLLELHDSGYRAPIKADDSGPIDPPQGDSEPSDSGDDDAEASDSGASSSDESSSDESSSDESSSDESSSDESSSDESSSDESNSEEGA